MSALPRPMILPFSRQRPELRPRLRRHDVEVPVEVDRPRVPAPTLPRTMHGSSSSRAGGSSISSGDEIQADHRVAQQAPAAARARDPAGSRCRSRRAPRPAPPSRRRAARARPAPRQRGRGRSRLFPASGAAHERHDVAATPRVADPRWSRYMWRVWMTRSARAPESLSRRAPWKRLARGRPSRDRLEDRGRPTRPRVPPAARPSGEPRRARDELDGTCKQPVRSRQASRLLKAECLLIPPGRRVGSPS